jgi:hypothetical protein
VYSDVHQALRAVPHERPAQPAGGVSPAVISAHFYLFLYESCFSGSVPVDAHVIAVLKDNAGNLLAKRQFNEQDDGASDGEFWTCFDWSSFHELFPGYRVTFKVYGAPGGALLGTFNAPVPNIRFTGLNKAQAQVSGTGPAGKAFTLWWSQHRLNAAGTWAGNTVNGTITPGGTWFADVSTGSIRGGAQLYLRVEQTPAVSVDLSMHAPNIYCQLRGPYCSIYGFPLQTLTIQLKKGATTYTRSGQADSRGWLGVPFRTATGAPIVVQPGDMVAGTNVAWYTQPALTFNAFNFAGDIISGTAPPSKYFWIWVHAYGWGPDWWHGYWKGSSAAGAFAVDTTADYNLVSTETSEAEIWFMHPATGNETDFTRVYAP